jgi:hypothetical protein
MIIINGDRTIIVWSCFVHIIVHERFFCMIGIQNGLVTIID